MASLFSMTALTGCHLRTRQQKVRSVSLTSHRQLSLGFNAVEFEQHTICLD